MNYNKRTLCLYEDSAKPFLKYPVGTKLTLTVEAVLTGAGLEPDEEGDEIPAVEFTFTAVEGKKRLYADYSNSEMEQEIHDVMNGEETPKAKPDSIFKQVKRQENLGKLPFQRVNKPVVLR